MYPVLDTTVAVAVRAMLKWTATFGCPSQVFTDNGPQFANEMVAEFVTLVGSDHIFTMPYSSEENGLLERANKEVVRHLRAILFDKSVVYDWGYLYPLVERVINAEMNESLGVPPS